MTRQVEYQNRSQKFIRRLESRDKLRIQSSIEELKHDPIPGPKKVVPLRQWPGLMRMRVGDFRVIFRIYEQKLHLVLVDNRADDRVYERLERLLGN